MLKKGIFECKARLVHPGAFRKLNELMESQHLPLEVILQRQEIARRDIVRHAFENTKFYHDFYSSAGFQIGDIGSSGWFEKLPILTKQHLRNHFDEMTWQNRKGDLGISRTGGSTGIPTKCGYDRKAPYEVYGWRMLSWFGINPWDDHAYVWRQSRRTRWAKFKNAAAWWPTRHLKADASQLTDESKLEFLNSFNRIRPTLLQGYVGAIFELSQFVLDRGIEVHAPKMVWVTSAPLLPSYRKTIEDAFHAKVCDQYGSCEVGWFAQQCEQGGGLHVNTEHVHLEFVDDAGAAVPMGTYGRTLLTSLEDRVFPVIRYENGDTGCWLDKACLCGRTLPLMGPVKGRLTETFVLPSGTTLDGIFMTSLFDKYPEAVKAFRATQHKDLSITFEYVLGSEGQAAVDKVHKAFEEHILHEVPVEFRRVDEIPHDRGKLRFVVRER